MAGIRPYDGSTQPIRLPQVGSSGAAPAAIPATGARDADGVSSSGDPYRDRVFSVSSRISAIERQNVEALKADDVLSDLGKLLQDLRSAVKGAAAVRAGDDEALVSAQQQVDEIASTVANAAERVGGGIGQSLRRSATGVTAVSDQAVVGVARARLEPGERLDIQVEVTASAQTAGFLLSFGQLDLNLGGAWASDGAGSRFHVEIEGSAGKRELSFASGTRISDIAAGINHFMAVTGVKARVSGTAIRLESSRFGSDEFVSVRTIDNGQINTTLANAGVYRLQESNANAVRTDPRARVLWSAASNTVTDSGQDVQATVNGGYAEGKGTKIRALSLQFFVDFNLATGSPGADGVNAQNLGSFRAFTLVGLPLPRGVEDVRPGGPLAPTPGDSTGAESLVDTFTAEIDARREAIADERRALAEQIGALQGEMSRLISERNGAPPANLRADDANTLDAQAGALTPDRVAALLRARLFGQQS